MSTDYIDIIKKVSLFRGLKEEAIVELLSSFSIVEVPENALLFSQGDNAGSMYILLSGYLLATLKTKDGHIENIGKIYPGESVGEMGLITKKPRSLSIKALTDSKLFELPEERFVSFVKSNPDAMYQILISTSNRTQNTLDILAHAKVSRHIFMTSTNYLELRKTPFIKNLKNLIHDQKEILFLEEEYLEEIYNSKGFDELTNYLDKSEQSYNTIIYYMEEGTKNLTDLLLKRTSLLAMVALGDQKPEFSKFNQEILKKQEIQSIEKKLVLLWQENTPINNTRYWLEKADFNLHHHVVLNDDSTYARLLRFLQGKPIGLVLGGGGFRGFSHLGVIKALKEKNIPIDAIGGSSVGAGTAAYYLISKNSEELIHHVEETTDYVRKSVEWLSLTWPAISLYSGTPATNFTRTVFGNQRIEDLPIPYFAVSCNISKNAEVIHRTYKIWRAIRASAAVPGLFPPLVEEGDLLYDGGLLNNLPTDCMRQILGNNAIIFASDLGMLTIDNNYYKFPASISLFDFLLMKFRGQKNRYVFPPLFSTIFRAMLIGSFPKYQQNIRLANYYIHPDFSGYSPIFMEKSSQSETLQLGYESTLAIVKNWNYNAEN